MGDARIRLGMVGGGRDALIGAVHRIAARIDGRFDLVAGALSSTPEKSRESGAALGLPAERTYDDFRQMAAAEAARADGIEAVAIVTPNHVHAPAAEAFLAHGIHVICDKPLAASQTDAEAMARAVADSGALFVLTHTYTGYPMIRHARQAVSRADRPWHPRPGSRFVPPGSPRPPRCRAWRTPQGSPLGGPPGPG